jgi:GH25 family lysozyme M1 (1,4-beta-N-acetylmuramidase)
MKLSLSTLLTLGLGTMATPTASNGPLLVLRSNDANTLEKRAASVQGFDISHYQGTVNFASAYSGGLRFVYIKATEGTTYKDPDFTSHYNGATSAGFIRGGYHFADGTGDGTQEATFFLANGGGWSDDGITLPGMLDLEGDCISVAWITNFSNTYHAKTGRWPVLYSSPSWWESCTGNSAAFKGNSPLFMACYDASPCTPQGTWPYYTIWQYNDSNKYGGDSDVFNGDLASLKKLATG